MTNEEVLNLIQHKLDLAVDDALIMTDKEYEVFSLCAKALEKEARLEKIRAEIADTLYVDSLIFGELIDFRNGKISADDVIEEFNRVTRLEVLQIIDKYRK